MNILIVDHHILLRQGLASLLNSQAGIHVIGEADNSDEMVSKALNLNPQLILVGVDYFDEDELSAIRTITSQREEIKVIIISNEITADLLIASLLAGVKGLIPKDIPLTNLVSAIRAVERGEVAFPRKTMHWIVDEYLRLRITRNHDGSKPDENIFNSLTSRELEVLKLVSTGATNREIAERLYIAENTVRVHVHQILKKLRLQNRYEVRKFANRLGFNQLKDYE